MDAALELTTASAISGTHQFKIWGLEHNDADWNWDESTVQFNNSPGLAFDGNSRTLGIDPRYTADGQPAEEDNYPLDTPGLYSLGTFSVGPTAAGQTVSFDGLNLAVMLNLAAYFEGSPQEGLVSLILEQTNATAANVASFWSKEGNALLAPRLVVDAVLAVPPDGLMGDYNGDDTINAADYTVWRDALTAGSNSLLNDPTPGTVDENDFLYWRDHFGQALGGGSGQGSAVVPEPASMALLLVGGLFVLGRYLRRTKADGHQLN
jgi:hypothetical protein